MNKYYLLHRPVGIGCQPKGFVKFETFDNRTYVSEIGREAWSVIWYDRKLTHEELRDYEMVSGDAILTPEFTVDEIEDVIASSDYIPKTDIHNLAIMVFLYFEGALIDEDYFDGTLESCLEYVEDNGGFTEFDFYA